MRGARWLGVRRFLVGTLLGAALDVFAFVSLRLVQLSL